MQNDTKLIFKYISSVCLYLDRRVSAVVCKCIRNVKEAGTGGRAGTSKLGEIEDDVDKTHSTNTQLQLSTIYLCLRAFAAQYIVVPQRSVFIFNSKIRTNSSSMLASGIRRTTHSEEKIKNKYKRHANKLIAYFFHFFLLFWSTFSAIESEICWRAAGRGKHYYYYNIRSIFRLPCASAVNPRLHKYIYRESGVAHLLETKIPRWPYFLAVSIQFNTLNPTLTGEYRTNGDCKQNRWNEE